MLRTRPRQKVLPVGDSEVVVAWECGSVCFNRGQFTRLSPKRIRVTGGLTKGNSSGGLLTGHQSRDGLTLAMPGNCGGQIFKRVAPVHAASLRNGEKAHGGQFACGAAIAKACLAALHARPQRAFRAIVVWLHSRMFEKCKQAAPNAGEPTGSATAAGGLARCRTCATAGTSWHAPPAHPGRIARPRSLW